VVPRISSEFEHSSWDYGRGSSHGEKVVIPLHNVNDSCKVHVLSDV